VQQFEGRRCHQQWPGECNVDSVFRDCWCVRNRFFKGTSDISGLGPPTYQGLMIILKTGGIGYTGWGRNN